ncbi:MAG TPA: hypothetical protein VGM82_00010 [Gemmatimonadaceae bacterium]|jgi:hypothetical protein
MPIPADYPAFDSAEARLLFECKLEIEERWKNGEGAEPVHRLARAHPPLAKELYMFFADMLQTYVNPSSSLASAPPDEPRKPT